MSILNLLQGLTAPKNDLGVISTDGLKDSITGTKQNDKLSYDATKFDTGETFVELDGGQGFDTLTITLTASQHAAMKAELQAKAKGFLGGLKGGNFDLIGDLLNALAGQKFVEIASLGLRFKAWESVKFDVVPDPAVPVVAAPTWIDESGRGNFSASDKSVDLDLSQSKLELEENSPASGGVQPSSVDAYFAGGDAVAGFSFTPSIYIGSAFSDRLMGDDSSNIFSGEGGNDFLSGRGGNDELRGEDGDDVIDGGAGDDWVVGGNGDDTFSYGAGDGSDAVAGGAGIDTLAVKLNADTGKRYVFQGTATGFDFSVQTVAAVTEATSSISGVERAELALGNDEALLVIGDTGLSQVVATGGNMLSLATMTGSTKVTANLGIRDDTFLGGGHAVGAVVDGGEGEEVGGDYVNYSQIGGPVAINLQAGTALRNGVTDTVTNFEHAVGSAGNDTITGSVENNGLYGEGGDDTFVYNPGNGASIAGDGSDTVDGGAGTDTLVVNRLGELQNRYDLTATANGFNFSIDHNYNGPPEETVTTSNVEKVDLSLKQHEWFVVTGNFTGLSSINVTGDDEGQSMFLFGLASATAVTANLAGGNDQVYGGSHSTGAVVNGEDGVDSLDYGQISASINADLAAGTVVRNGVTDKMTNFENVSGTILADTIQGTAGGNSIYGQGGDDTLTGAMGNDTLDGGEGNDLFVYNPGNGSTIVGDGSDIVDGGAGTDTLMVNRLSELQNRYDITATANGFNFSVDHNYNGSPEETITTSNVEKIDVSLKQYEQVVVTGNFTGLSSINVTGDDEGQSMFLFGLASATAVTANLAGGNDEVYGGSHPTGAVINGGDGVDTLNYGLNSGQMIVNLAAGTVVRNGVTDKMTNFENVFGTGVADTIQGNAAANSIYGQGGNDIINGQDGNDYLDGGDGHDNIQGGAGDDIILGGAGSDTITTGTGADVVRSGATTDWINNTFDADIDQFIFDVAGLDAIHGGVFAGDRLVFDVAGSPPMTDPEVFFQAEAGGTVLVYTMADFDGNGTNEMAGARIYDTTLLAAQSALSFDFI